LGCHRLPQGSASLSLSHTGSGDGVRRKLASYTAPKSILNEVIRGQGDDPDVRTPADPPPSLWVTLRARWVTVGPTDTSIRLHTRSSRCHNGRISPAVGSN
jgi:hypothetical protein